MGGLLRVKFSHYLDYSPEGTKRCESALLTIWAVLNDFRDDLVLVGGLVPRYICKLGNLGLQPATMDVDLGLDLGASSGQYDSISVRLQNEGFEAVKADELHQKNRFTKQMQDGSKLILDLLTDKPTPDSPDTVQVENFWANAFPGIERALNVYREIRINGQDILGAEAVETVKVCEIGPFLCLKLNGYTGRAQSKDVFDVVYSVMNYDKGHQEAARLFHAEAGKNRAYEPARQILEQRFQNERSKGPVHYAEFCTSGRTGADIDDIHARYLNEAVDVARVLLKL